MHKNTVEVWPAGSCLMPGGILWQRNKNHLWLVPGNPEI